MKITLLCTLVACVFGAPGDPKNQGPLYKLINDKLWDPAVFPSAEDILNRHSGRSFTIAVEGNVGSGKSTLIEYFHQYPDISLYPEPVDVWMDLNGTDFLGLTYQNPSRWGMSFESLVQLTMLEHHLKDGRRPDRSTPPVKVMERSLQSAQHCFVKQLSGVMEPAEVTVLASWYDLFRDQPEFDIDVDVILYLRTVPEVIFDRIAKRNRNEELRAPLEYFQEMHRLHEDWLVHRNSSGSLNLPPVIIIEADQDIAVLSPTYRKLAEDIYRSIPDPLRTYKMYH